MHEHALRRPSVVAVAPESTPRLLSTSDLVLLSPAIESPGQTSNDELHPWHPSPRGAIGIRRVAPLPERERRQLVNHVITTAE